MIPIPPMAVLAAGCPALAPLPDGPGTASVVHVPSAAALAANNEGKALYRQGRWTEAHARYQAALAADPEFLAPALNAACALARQERFPEAARAAVALVHRGFVPWGREVLEAADLAALHVRPEMSTLRTAVAEAGAAWGRSSMDGLFFVARTRPAVRLDGQGVLVLSLNQELFAWLPQAGRYRQLTADDGRVLAAVRSDDGRAVLYVRAGKLVRSPGAAPVLRGLSLRRLDLPGMTLSAPIELPGDVESLALWPARGLVAELQVRRSSATTTYRLMGEALVVAPSLSSEARTRRPVLLNARGVEEAGRAAGSSACPYQATDEQREGQAPGIRIKAGKRELLLGAPLGAGLQGLPFPRGK
jgi:hypothetical protein